MESDTKYPKFSQIQDNQELIYPVNKQSLVVLNKIIDGSSTLNMGSTLANQSPAFRQSHNLDEENFSQLQLRQSILINQISNNQNLVVQPRNYSNDVKSPSLLKQSLLSPFQKQSKINSHNHNQSMSSQPQNPLTSTQNDSQNERFLSNSLTYFDNSSLQKNKVKNIQEFKLRYHKWQKSYLQYQIQDFLHKKQENLPVELNYEQFSKNGLGQSSLNNQAKYQQFVQNFMDKVQKMGIKQNQKIINNSMREGNIQPIHLGLKSQFSNISKGNYNNSFYQQDGSLTTSYGRRNMRSITTEGKLRPKLQNDIKQTNFTFGEGPSHNNIHQQNMSYQSEMETDYNVNLISNPNQQTNQSWQQHHQLNLRNQTTFPGMRKQGDILQKQYQQQLQGKDGAQLKNQIIRDKLQKIKDFQIPQKEEGNFIEQHSMYDSSSPFTGRNELTMTNFQQFASNQYQTRQQASFTNTFQNLKNNHNQTASFTLQKPLKSSFNSNTYNSSHQNSQLIPNFNQTFNKQIPQQNSKQTNKNIVTNTSDQNKSIYKLMKQQTKNSSISKIDSHEFDVKFHRFLSGSFKNKKQALQVQELEDDLEEFECKSINKNQEKTQSLLEDLRVKQREKFKNQLKLISQKVLPVKRRNINVNDDILQSLGQKHPITSHGIRNNKSLGGNLNRRVAQNRNEMQNYMSRHECEKRSLYQESIFNKTQTSNFEQTFKSDDLSYLIDDNQMYTERQNPAYFHSNTNDSRKQNQTQNIPTNIITQQNEQLFNQLNQIDESYYENEQNVQNAYNQNGFTNQLGQEISVKESFGLQNQQQQQLVNQHLSDEFDIEETQRQLSKRITSGKKNYISERLDETQEQFLERLEIEDLLNYRIQSNEIIQSQN